MSYKLMQMAARCQWDDHLGRHILLILASFADDDGACFPSIDTIVACSGISRSTVKRQLVDLEKRRAIQVQRTRTSNRYRINVGVAFKSLWTKDLQDTKVQGDPRSTENLGSEWPLGSERTLDRSTVDLTKVQPEPLIGQLPYQGIDQKDTNTTPLPPATGEVVVEKQKLPDPPPDPQPAELPAPPDPEPDGDLFGEPAPPPAKAAPVAKTPKKKSKPLPGEPAAEAKPTATRTIRFHILGYDSRGEAFKALWREWVESGLYKLQGSAGQGQNDDGIDEALDRLASQHTLPMMLRAVRNYAAEMEDRKSKGEKLYCSWFKYFFFRQNQDRTGYEYKFLNYFSTEHERPTVQWWDGQETDRTTRAELMERLDTHNPNYMTTFALTMDPLRRIGNLAEEDRKEFLEDPAKLVKLQEKLIEYHAGDYQEQQARCIMGVDYNPAFLKRANARLERYRGYAAAKEAGTYTPERMIASELEAWAAESNDTLGSRFAAAVKARNDKKIPWSKPYKVTSVVED